MLKYNGVVVIQSLPDEEDQTGKMLYDDIIARRCQQHTKASYFFNPASKKELFAALTEIAALVINDELMPIIHYEIHGSPDGLVMKSGELMKWVELQERCRLINIQLQNQLIITLATCWGSEIWKMIDITQPAPYWGYIGPKQEIGVNTLMEDFTEFYDTLLTEESWDQAIQKLKFNGTRGQYIYLHCKGIFEYHIERRFKDTAIDKKATFKRLAGASKQQLPGMNRRQRRDKLKISINKFDRNAFLQKMKKAFLMS